MTSSAYAMCSYLPFVPNKQQEELIGMLADFERGDASGWKSAGDANGRRAGILGDAFILRGYAGTGKTSVVSALLKYRRQCGQKTVLLAPTGRAAKVLAAYSGHNAYTIHKCIYRQQSAGVQRFTLAENLRSDTLFIVDEASMISNDGGDTFGSGNLLDDLVQYVYSGNDCRLLLLGDTAQLPPVGQSVSAALSPEFVSGYGLKVTYYTLTQVARQALESGILCNATGIRQALVENRIDGFFKFLTDGFADVSKLDGRDFVDVLSDAYRQVGVEETMVVVRTNRRAMLYNNGIRTRILWREEKVENGDRIMVTKNNYFFTEKYEGMDFIANGDILEVERISHQREMYGFTFADMSLRSVDYDWEIDVVALLDSLEVDTQERQREMQDTLFNRIAEDYPEYARNRRKLVKAVMENPYYNALQFKHAYAATCHKCQGGQWKRVFVDQGSLQPEQVNQDYYRWLYTAVTRATEKLYLINF